MHDLDSHPCPGGCGNHITRDKLACKPCWFRLPEPIRNNINTAYRNKAANRLAHWQAIARAADWYHSHHPDQRRIRL